MTIPNGNFYGALNNRKVIELRGLDRAAFLQGLITQDVNLLESQPIIYSLMLSPQGKFQFDFFIIKLKDSWLIDIDSNFAEAFLQRLQLFKLRSDVEIKINNDWHVAVSAEPIEYENCFLDPRFKELGCRIYGKEKINKTVSDVYEKLRLILGIPDGAKDMIVNKSIPLEWGMDELNAISWNKGCYMGQELTARTRYVGQIRKRIFHVSFDDSRKHAVGDKLTFGDKEVGQLRTVIGNVALAMIDIDSINLDVTVNGSVIKIYKPCWMILPISNQE